LCLKGDLASFCQNCLDLAVISYQQKPFDESVVVFVKREISRPVPYEKLLGCWKAAVMEARLSAGEISKKVARA
jgi:hypothetical protein